MKLKIVLCLAIVMLAVIAVPAFAQTAGTITFTAEATTGNGSVVPKLTWSTTPAATSCTASGDWTGVKAAGGTLTLPAITKSAAYTLACSWPKDRATVKWTLPVTNTDGSAYTNPKAVNVYFGQTAATLKSQTPQVLAPTATQTILGPLTPGVWNFAVTAVNSGDVESDLSNIPSLTMSALSASKNITITVNPQPSPPANVTAE